jgi:hypothetical protein
MHQTCHATRRHFFVGNVPYKNTCYTNPLHCLAADFLGYLGAGRTQCCISHCRGMPFPVCCEALLEHILRWMISDCEVCLV